MLLPLPQAATSGLHRGSSGPSFPVPKKGPRSLIGSSPSSSCGFSGPRRRGTAPLVQFVPMLETRLLGPPPPRDLRPPPLTTAGTSATPYHVSSTAERQQSTSRSTGPRSCEEPAEETHHALHVAGDLSSALHHAGTPFSFRAETLLSHLKQLSNS